MLGTNCVENQMARQSMSRYFDLLVLMVTLSGALSVHSQQWAQLPPTPDLPKPERSGMTAVDGIRLWYAVFGAGSPVVLVHGGMGNSNYWGLQIPALARQYQ